MNYVTKNVKYINKFSRNTHSTSAVCSHRDRTVDSTKGNVHNSVGNVHNEPGPQAGGAVYTRLERVIYISFHS